MVAKIVLCMLPFVLVVSHSSADAGATWYVDGAVSQSGDGTSWERAFKTIQEGIDGAHEGDTVIVGRGIYVENVRFRGKNVALTSTDPLDSGVVESTIIDGNKDYSAVEFTGTEGETCVIAGFSIRNGDGGITCEKGTSRTRAAIQNNIIRGNLGTGVSGCDGSIRKNIIVENDGGLYDCDGVIQDNTISDNWVAEDGGGLDGCDGIIQNNLITENSARGTRPQGAGGGLSYCLGMIRGNTISGNSAFRGAGLYECDGTIEGNVISENSAFEGGGLYGCDGTIENNRISGNIASDGGLMGCSCGGGLACCQGNVRNNLISGNSADYGGGVFFCQGTIENNLISGNGAGLYGGGLGYCNGTVQNNTICGNFAGWYGAGMTECRGEVRNCIVWGNVAKEPGSQIYKSSTPTYTCIQGWAEGGEGNIVEDPQFMDPRGEDYRLQPRSPCVDAGVNYYWFVWPQRDADGNCRLVGDAVDMGCYEFGSFPDRDGDLLSDPDESAAGTEPEAEDTDGDGLRDGLELLRHSDPAEPTPARILRVASEWPTIQVSLFLALKGDEIVVEPGVYRENVRFLGAEVMVRSSDPDSPEIVERTVIDGGGEGPVLTLTGEESEACTIAGFTIQNGKGEAGAGICGGTQDKFSCATIRNNIITRNEGAGVSRCDGTIRDNSISENEGPGVESCDGEIRRNVVAGNHRRGLRFCGGIIEKNTISRNLDGGLEWCHGLIRDNVISGNSSRNSGGGLYYCSGTVRANRIGQNSAGEDGGGLASCDGTIEDNTIIGNRAEGNGGGMARCRGMIQGNTITWNKGERGGGLYECGGWLYDSDGEVRENGIAYNSALDGAGLYGCNGIVEGNSIAWNLADYAGGGLCACDGRVVNNEIGWNGALDGGGLARCNGEICGNRLRGNSAERGGGLYDCDGTIEDNDIGLYYDAGVQIYGNSAGEGGGLYGCDGTIKENRVLCNSATTGGGLYECGARVEGNTVSQNSAERNGGGLAYCGGFVVSNAITSNSAEEDGGGVYRCDGRIQNNIIAGNRADFGGGLAYCRGMIVNDTIVSNSGFRGGGLHGCTGVIRSCVVWGNTAQGGGQLWESSEPTYSCVQDWTGGGEGNVADDVLFVDPDGPDDNAETYGDNDYRLLPDSPCIDAGDNSLLNPAGFDPDGNLRIAVGRSSLRVDMGAYEYNSVPFSVAGIERHEGGIRLIWNSQPNDAYTVWSFENLFSSKWDWIKEATVPSAGTVTRWTDLDPASPRKFYKVRMNQVP